MVRGSLRPYLAPFLLFLFFCTALIIFRSSQGQNITESIKKIVVETSKAGQNALGLVGSDNTVTDPENSFKPEKDKFLEEIEVVITSTSASSASSSSFEQSTTQTQQFQTTFASSTTTANWVSSKSSTFVTSESKTSKTPSTAPKPVKKPKPNPVPLMNVTFSVADNPQRNPEGPRPDQFVILSASNGKGTGSIENVLELSAENRQHFADKHGYINHYVNMSKFDLHGAHPVWGKILSIVDTFQEFPEAEWIWCLDLDAIIMTPSTDVISMLFSKAGQEKILLRDELFHNGYGFRSSATPVWEDIDLIMSQDFMSINAGSFFIRRSKYTQFLVDLWLDPEFVNSGWNGREQEALLHLLRYHLVFRDHLGLVPQNTINAYAGGGPPQGFRKGDLIVHFAGCWMGKHCQKMYDDWWPKREL